MKLKFAVSQEYLRPVTSHHGTFAGQSKPKQFPYFDVDISTDCSLCKVKILHLKYEAIPNSWEQCKEVVQEDESFMNYPFSPPKGSLDKIVQGNPTRCFIKRLQTSIKKTKVTEFISNLKQGR